MCCMRHCQSEAHKVLYNRQFAAAAGRQPVLRLQGAPLAHLCKINMVFELPTTTHHSPPGLHAACLPTKFVEEDSVLWARSGSWGSSVLYLDAHDSRVSGLYSLASVCPVCPDASESLSLPTPLNLPIASALCRGVNGLSQLGVTAAFDLPCKPAMTS